MLTRTPVASEWQTAARQFVQSVWVLLLAGMGMRVFFAAAAEPGPEFHPTRLLLKPRHGVDRGNVARFHAQQGARVLREFPRIEGIQVLQLPAGTDVPAMARRYEGSGLVEFAEPDYRVHPANAS